MSETNSIEEGGTKGLDEQVLEVLAIEAEGAKKAGALGYMVRALMLATLPHRELPGNEFKRENGVCLEFAKKTTIRREVCSSRYRSFSRIILIFRDLTKDQAVAILKIHSQKFLLKSATRHEF